MQTVFQGQSNFGYNVGQTDLNGLINSIPASTWAYLGTINQNLSTISNVNFNSVNSNTINTTDGGFRIQNSANLTKKIAFDASAITAGQTRSIIMPDSNVNLGTIASGDFPDSTFYIYNSVDNSKHCSINVGNVSTLTNRTITMCDGNLDLTSPSFIGRVECATSPILITNGQSWGFKASSNITSAVSGDAIGIDFSGNLLADNGSCTGCYLSNITSTAGGNVIGLHCENLTSGALNAYALEVSSITAPSGVSTGLNSSTVISGGTGAQGCNFTNITAQSGSAIGYRANSISSTVIGDSYALNFPSVSSANGKVYGCYLNSLSATGDNCYCIYAPSIISNSKQAQALSFGVIESKNDNASLINVDTQIYASGTSGDANAIFINEINTDAGSCKVFNIGSITAVGNTAEFLYSAILTSNFNSYGFDFLSIETTGNAKTAYGANFTIIQSTGIGSEVFGFNAGILQSTNSGRCVGINIDSIDAKSAEAVFLNNTTEIKAITSGNAKYAYSALIESQAGDAVGINIDSIHAASVSGNKNAIGIHMPSIVADHGNSLSTGIKFTQISSINGAAIGYDISTQIRSFTAGDATGFRCVDLLADSGNATLIDCPICESGGGGSATLIQSATRIKSITGSSWGMNIHQIQSNNANATGIQIDTISCSTAGTSGKTATGLFIGAISGITNAATAQGIEIDSIDSTGSTATFINSKTRIKATTAGDAYFAGVNSIESTNGNARGCYFVSILGSNEASGTVIDTIHTTTGLNASGEYIGTITNDAQSAQGFYVGTVTGHNYATAFNAGTVHSTTANEARGLSISAVTADAGSAQGIRLDAVTSANGSNCIGYYIGSLTETTGATRTYALYCAATLGRIRTVLPVSTGATVQYDAGGEIVQVASTRRFKENINYDNVQSDWIYKLKPATFDYKKEHYSGEDRFGHTNFIAEDIEKINPKYACKDSEGQITGYRDIALIPLIINELQLLRENVVSSFDGVKSDIINVKKQTDNSEKYNAGMICEVAKLNQKVDLQDKTIARLFEENASLKVEIAKNIESTEMYKRESIAAFHNVKQDIAKAKAHDEVHRLCLEDYEKQIKSLKAEIEDLRVLNNRMMKNLIAMGHKLNFAIE